MPAPSTMPDPLTYHDIDLHFLLQADDLFLRLLADAALVGAVR